MALSQELCLFLVLSKIISISFNRTFNLSLCNNFSFLCGDYTVNYIFISRSPLTSVNKLDEDERLLGWNNSRKMEDARCYQRVKSLRPVSDSKYYRNAFSFLPQILSWWLNSSARKRRKCTETMHRQQTIPVTNMLAQMSRWFVSEQLNPVLNENVQNASHCDSKWPLVGKVGITAKFAWVNSVFTTVGICWMSIRQLHHTLNCLALPHALGRRQKKINQQLVFSSYLFIYFGYVLFAFVE